MKFIDLQKQLDERSEAGLFRERKVLGSGQQTEVLFENKRFVNFASNDYLGLASNPTAVQSMMDSAKKFGFGSGASHLICGHQQPHQQLEVALAKFVKRDAALTFSTGYMANLAILQSLAQKGNLIIADKLNHASLIDGAILSRADSCRYNHCDMEMLANRLATSGQNKFVVTDGVFSMDGDIAPLVEIVRLCEKYNAILIVDDAHGFGVLGEHGGGVCDALQLNQKQVPVLMATLGKAIGGYGAFVAGEKALIEYLMQFARSYIYTTAMPAAVASGNLSNLVYCQENPSLRKKLQHNIQFFKRLSQLRQLTLLPSETAIQPLMIGCNQSLMALDQKLRDAGFLVGAIRPPTVPKNSARLRITLSAAHTEMQIEKFVDVLDESLRALK